MNPDARLREALADLVRYLGVLVESNALTLPVRAAIELGRQLDAARAALKES